MTTMRTLIATLLALGALTTGLPALASSDMGCDHRLMPASVSYTDCTSTALLAPGNDTRVNLALMMMDAHGSAAPATLPPADPLQRPERQVPFGWSSFSHRVLSPDKVGDDSNTWASGEGTVCVSHDRGQADFVQALKADRKLPEDERGRLIEARSAMACPVGEGAASPTNVAATSAEGRAFAEYLHAAQAFYAGKHDPAPFQALAGSKQPWVREAARYMVGRAWALVAQANGFGTYGEVEHERMDTAALANAEAALKAYLKAYPEGRYAASAHGLIRRVHWLAGDTDALVAAYGWQIDQRDAAQHNLHAVELAQEIDVKLPEAAYLGKAAHPLLVATHVLRRMRKFGDDDSGRITRQEIDALRPRFKGREALHDYLLAAHAYFVDRAPHRVLELIPAEAPSRPMDTLAFSRQTLRALALDTLKDKDARSALTALFPQAKTAYQRHTLELALAMHDERNGEIARVFAPGSLVVDPALREQLLIHAAGPDLLRARADDAKASKRERALALYVLLYKQLTRGRHAEFLKDVKRLPAKIDTDPTAYDKLGGMTALADFRWQGTREAYVCPSLQQIATTLAADAGSRKASLCLGDFFRLNDYDRTESWAFTADKDELGGTPGQFPGRFLPRQRIYQTIIDDAAAPAEERAYALFRAVNCYAPAGHNDCGGDDVPVATRKAWFNQLKSRYPQSAWAKQLRYYW
jgi:hypothetical protein